MIHPIVTRSVAKPVVHNVSNQGISAYDPSYESNPPKILKTRNQDDNGFAIPKSSKTDNVKRIANKFDNNKAETPSPIKSSGIKNRYIADEDDGGEGSFDNLIGKVTTTTAYKAQNEQSMKQFDQFGRRLNPPQTSARVFLWS